MSSLLGKDEPEQTTDAHMGFGLSKMLAGSNNLDEHEGMFRLFKSYRRLLRTSLARDIGATDASKVEEHMARPWVVCVSDCDQGLLQLTRWDPEAFLKWDATVYSSPPDEDKPYQSYVSIVFATWIVSGPGSVGVNDTLRRDSVRKKVSNRRGVSYRRRQLVEDKAKIVQSHNSHKKFSSALWRFPPEILAEIFLYYMLENEDWTPAPNLAPMVLTAVCKRWREVAVDTSSLWRKLRLEVGHGNWQQRAFCYDSYLKRSRGRQLSLAPECHNDDDGMERLEELVMYTTVSVPVLTIAHSVVLSITKLPPNMHTLKLMNLWFDLKMLSGFNPLAWVNLTNLEIVVGGRDAGKIVALPTSILVHIRESGCGLDRKSRAIRYHHAPQSTHGRGSQCR
ncbi:uncharacterized protein F5891DRAFT_982916 [Suillus fuscotomentosus]|uniref:F-box domain-containing protein n=1 Tax=Suillus fuscotomentosus TaxID=1912939 RepID=A0AAD4DZT0_9AGAM|nr:uncharacterized protein F5891DRAFT_982916 [Suillus fuscotomentosus]KAG1897114.1 hypothetical protein F5891DRAFT_982916 [Suillus fuscotomentosus]